MALPTLSSILTAVSESTYFARLTAAFDAASVPWKSWSLRNPFLAVSKFTTAALSAASTIVAYLANGMYLDTGEGDALTLFAKSQYQLDRFPAIFTQGRILLTSVPAAPSNTFVPGEIQVGTPGPIATSKIYVNSEGGTLSPGGTLLINFTANTAGDSYNLPVGANLDMKTSVAGVTATNPASGPPDTIGVGNSSLVFYAKDTGVSVKIVNNGPSQPLIVNANIITKLCMIQLRTDGAGIAQSTAEEVRAAVKAALPIGALVIGQFVIECKNGGDGTGIVAITPSDVFLDFFSTWIQVAGAPPESDTSLKTRCRTRWDTLGGGAGDGHPVAALGTVDALTYWSFFPPAGYASSPVAHTQVYSNYDVGMGAVSGGVVSIVLAGPAGALAAQNVAAVTTNFFNPRKFAYGTRLLVVSAVNLVVPIAGTVNVLISSGKSTATVGGEIAAAMATYPIDIGMTLYPQNIGAHLAAADFAAIRNIVLTAPAAQVVCTQTQIPVFDLSGLVYVLV